MSPRDLNVAERDEALRQAVEKRLPLVASIWREGRWMLLKSRFLPRDPGGELLCIEPPTSDGPSHAPHPPVDVAAGSNVGITFRRGHHKCLFATTVVGRQRITLSAQLRADALLIRRPGSVQQLQRRAYMRALAPADALVGVLLRAGGCEVANDGGKCERRGRLGQFE